MFNGTKSVSSLRGIPCAGMPQTRRPDTAWPVALSTGQLLGATGPAQRLPLRRVGILKLASGTRPPS
jgi:hypothetical protein